jgi:hypothetical protein
VDANVIQVVIQGGAVGVAALTLLVMYKLLALGTSIVNNHLGSIMGALGAIGEKLDRLIDATEQSKSGERLRCEK